MSAAESYWRRVRDALPRDPARDNVDFTRSDVPPARAEFAVEEDQPPDEVSRREWMKLLGASVALAGAVGCVEEPEGTIVPRVESSPAAPPGEPLDYATSMVLDGFASGLLVQSRDGRPIKVDGNPEHPASLGATTGFEQASVLGLYDPDRASAVFHDGRPSSWRAFFDSVPLPGSARLWFVLEPQSGPHLIDLIERVKQRYPAARFVFHAPLSRTSVYRASRELFGRPLEPRYDFSAARTVVSLSSDFTASGPMQNRWARELSGRRRLASPTDDMVRLYVVETMPSPTGSVADHRLRVAPSCVAIIAAALLAELSDPVLDGRSSGEVLTERGLKKHTEWVRALALDLHDRRGESLVIAGEQQPPETHVLSYWLNAALGNLDRTIRFSEPVLSDPLERQTLSDLARAVEAEQVDGVVVLGSNPAYTAPADLDFSSWFVKVPYRAHLSLYYNETSALCRWFLPEAHYLESWGDARALDGTVSFVQPLIRPLKNGRTPAQVVAAFSGRRDASDRVLVREYWTSRWGGTDSGNAAWRNALQRGLVTGTEYASAFVRPEPAVARAAYRRAVEVAAPDLPRLEVAFAASPATYDGRFANNAWLLELPQPITKLTWDNAAMMSPATALRHGLEDGDKVALSVGERRLSGPALVVPGHADDAVTLPLGFGRDGSESLARGVGFNAFLLRTTKTPYFAVDARLSKLEGRHDLARAQLHFRQHGRELALHGRLDEYRAEPLRLTEGHAGPVASLLPVLQGGAGAQWGMSIDTTICTGCSACVIACQAENNIPVVGKRGVLQSRNMHWLRIDEYHHGSVEDPERVHQPMLCQHCENAPCEYVCPVYATVHSPDGLNEMVYNRCIGTRFCSNNCPYKVRRFNWLDYTDKVRDERRLQYNPEVTVRARGVMEKCTFCVQRIRRSEIESRIARWTKTRAPHTACQQACPTGAIQFGDLSEGETAVVRWRRQPRTYSALHELGTRPRTQYLAKIFNKNPEIES